MNKVTVLYSNSRIEFYAPESGTFDKCFNKFCSRFNKFEEGSALIDVSRYFPLDKSYYLSTKNVTGIYYTQVNYADLPTEEKFQLFSSEYDEEDDEDEDEE